MLRPSPRLTSVARVAAGALTVVSIFVGWQPSVDAATPTTPATTTSLAPAATTTAPSHATTTVSAECRATFCVFRHVGQTLLHVPTGVRLLRVDVVGADGVRAPAKAPTSRAALKSEARDHRSFEVEANLALTPAETSLEVVVGAPDALGASRSAIESVGSSGTRALVAVGGVTPTASTLPTTTLPTQRAAVTTAPAATTTGPAATTTEPVATSKATAAASDQASTKATTVPTSRAATVTAETIVPPGSSVEPTAKPEGVIVSWVPPGIPPTIHSASTVHFSEGLSQSLQVVAEAAIPPTLVEQGAVPKGTTWRDNGNGTATLSGIPLVAGRYPLTVTATAGRSVRRRLELIVGPRPGLGSPPSVRIPAPSTTTPAVTPTTSAPKSTAPTIAPTTIAPTTTAAPTGPQRGPAPSTPASPPSTASSPTPPTSTLTKPVPANSSPTTSRPTTSRSGPRASGHQVVTTVRQTSTAPTSAPAASPTTRPVVTKPISKTKPTIRRPTIVAPKFTSPALAVFATGTVGSFAIAATGTPRPTLSEQGTLPAGLAFEAGTNGTATITGTPTQPGDFALTVTAQNGRSVAQHLVLRLIQAPVLSSAGTAYFATGTAGSFAIKATGSPMPTVSEQGPLPGGLTFHANADGTATITGTPTGPGDFALTITAENGLTVSQHLILDVTQPPAVTSATTATFTTGTGGNFVITATGTPTPTLSEVGTLPVGLTFHANGNGTATIAGTATQRGTYLITVTASNSFGATFTQRLSVEVTQQPFMTSAPTATFTQRMSGAFTIAAGGWPVPALTVRGSLPPGLTFNDNANGTATLAGTPTRAGTYAFSVTADNHSGTPSVQSVNVTVLLTPTTTKLSLRRTGGTDTVAALKLSAVVDPSAAVPTGTVTFRDREGSLGSATLDARGDADLTVHVPVGNHVLSATYEPSADSGFAASTSPTFRFFAAAPPGKSAGSGGLGSASFRHFLEIGVGVVVLGAVAMAAGTLMIRRRRPGRPA